MARRKIEWKLAIIISGVSAIVSLILFLITEIIWGDIIKDWLVSGYELHFYSNVNLILILGLLILFGVSFLTNIVIYRNYTRSSKIIANVLTLGITLVLLFFIAFISVIVLFAEQYQQYSIWQKLGNFWIFFAYFGIYVLSNPVWFWILGLILYHIILIFCIKLFFVENPRKQRRKRTQVKEVYSTKYSII